MQCLPSVSVKPPDRAILFAAPAGTLDYMAPEVLRCPVKEHPLDFKHCRTLQYNTSVDVWAVGVLAYELLVGFPPFSSSTPGNAMHKIMAASVVFPRHITAAAQLFVSEALRSHPGERPTIAEMSASAWLNGGKAKVRGWHKEWLCGSRG
jgi:serine/threonine protein kinase